MTHRPHSSHRSYLGQNALIWFVMILLVIIALYALAAVEFFRSSRVIILPDERPAAAQARRPYAFFRAAMLGLPRNPPVGAKEPALVLQAALKGYGLECALNLPTGGLISRPRLGPAVDASRRSLGEGGQTSAPHA